MDGQPVWLVSLSRRDAVGNILPTGRWPKGSYDIGYRLLAAFLDGVGDPSRERLFRMNVTLCLHRAASLPEQIMLPCDWGEKLAGMAGGPVEVLWSKGIPERPGALPCESPHHGDPFCGNPELWFPIDCGECPPCRARAALAVVS